MEKHIPEKQKKTPQKQKKKHLVLVTHSSSSSSSINHNHGMNKYSWKKSIKPRGWPLVQNFLLLLLILYNHHLIYTTSSTLLQLHSPTLLQPWVLRCTTLTCWPALPPSVVSCSALISPQSRRLSTRLTTRDTLVTPVPSNRAASRPPWPVAPS